MLQPDRIAYCFSLTHELPDVEFKGPGYGRDNPLWVKVVRAAMAMANRRGGGTLIIGVAELAAKEPSKTGKEFSFDGLNADQLATWKYEDIASGFNSYTNVPIEFDRQEYKHDGRIFLVLHIHQFATVPVMCINEYRSNTNPNLPNDQRKVILRPGAFYIRTLNNAESKEMLTSEQARNLFSLVGDKAIEGFVRHTRLASIPIAPLPNVKELYARELVGWEGTLLKDIRTRGYWDIRIQPAYYEEDRLPLSRLPQLLSRASLNYRGWEFPSITSGKLEFGESSIGLEEQSGNSLQAWRFFQSGQLVAVVGFLDDWAEKAPYGDRGTQPGLLLSTSDVVFRLTEVFGVAARLAITEVYQNDPFVEIDLRLHGLRDRRLYGRGIAHISSMHDYKTTAEAISYGKRLPKEDVIVRPKVLAREAAQYVFNRFGWEPSDQLLATIQSELEIRD